MTVEDSDESTARFFIWVHVGTWMLWLAGIAAFALFFEHMGTVGKVLAAVALGLFMPSLRDLPVLFRSKSEIAAHARGKQTRLHRSIGRRPPTS